MQGNQCAGCKSLQHTIQSWCPHECEVKLAGSHVREMTHIRLAGSHVGEMTHIKLTGVWVRKWWHDGPNFHFIICVGMELCISVCWNIATSKFWICFQVLWVPIVQRSTPSKFRLCFLSVMTFHWDISGRHQIQFVFLWCAQLVLDTRTKAQEGF